MGSVAIALLALTGCGSNAPQPTAAPTATVDKSLGAAIEAAASPSPDPLAPASGAPLPEATGGGAAVQ